MSKSLLIVDDDSDSLLLLSQRLQKKGFLVETANDGLEAVRRMRNLNLPLPDLVIMDVEMPHNGIEATQILKTDHRTRVVPVIILSGHIVGRKMSNVLSTGCDDVCLKPVDLAILEEKIFTCLNP